VLSGNRATEREYYVQFVAPLLTNLYGITPRLYEYRNSIFATITSKPLVAFKSEVVGLPIGKKSSLTHLPKSILDQGDKSVACLLSGLYDADGSVKVRRTPSGNYPRISFAQKSKGIVEDVKSHLASRFGILSTLYRNDYYDPRVSKVETRWLLDINGYANLRKFVEFVGSNHPEVNRRMFCLLSSSNAAGYSA
jgi:intein/homing endonuclease